MIGNRWTRICGAGFARSISVALLVSAAIAADPLCAQARPGANPVPVAEEAPPRIVDDLDCAALSFDVTRMQEAMIRPGPRDADRIMRDYLPAGFSMEKLRHMMDVDPAGLCRYRDANRNLAPAGPKRVIFIGDSITEIWGRASPDLFTGEVIDRGIAGQNTSQMLLRFQADVLALRPRVVHIMAGINDLNTPAGTVLTHSNFESMVRLAQASGVRVIIGAVTPSDGFWSAPHLKPAPQIRALNEWLRAFAARHGIAFVDYYAPLTNTQGGLQTELSNDGLHPNANGYALMTPLASAALKAALAAPTPPRTP